MGGKYAELPVSRSSTFLPLARVQGSGGLLLRFCCSASMWLLKIDTNNTEQSRKPSNAQSRAPSNPVQQQDVSMNKNNAELTRRTRRRRQKEEKTRKERESEVQSCALFPNVLRIQVDGWCFK